MVCMDAGDFRGKQFWLRFLQGCFFRIFMSSLFGVFPRNLIFKFLKWKNLKWEVLKNLSYQDKWYVWMQGTSGVNNFGFDFCKTATFENLCPVYLKVFYSELNLQVWNGKIRNGGFLKTLHIKVNGMHRCRRLQGWTFLASILAKMLLSKIYVSSKRILCITFQVVFESRYPEPSMAA